MRQCRIGKDLRCHVCGLVAFSENTRRNCRPGLGDRLAAGLDAIGITKDRVAAVLGNCGCEERQKALNQLGYKLGIGASHDVDR